MTPCVDSSTVIPATLTLSSGDAQTCFEISAAMDDILEDNEVLSITLTTKVPDLILDPDTVVVTIMDATGTDVVMMS